MVTEEAAGKEMTTEETQEIPHMVGIEKGPHTEQSGSIPKENSPLTEEKETGSPTEIKQQLHTEERGSTILTEQGHPTVLKETPTSQGTRLGPHTEAKGETPTLTETGQDPHTELTEMSMRPTDVEEGLHTEEKVTAADLPPLTPPRDAQESAQKIAEIAESTG